MGHGRRMTKSLLSLRRERAWKSGGGGLELFPWAAEEEGFMEHERVLGEVFSPLKSRFEQIFSYEYPMEP